MCKCFSLLQVKRRSFVDSDLMSHFTLWPAVAQTLAFFFHLSFLLDIRSLTCRPTDIEASETSLTIKLRNYVYAVILSTQVHVALHAISLLLEHHQSSHWLELRKPKLLVLLFALL